MTSIVNSKYINSIFSWLKNRHHWWILGFFLFLSLVVILLIYLLSISQLAKDLQVQLDGLQGRSTISVTMEESASEARLTWKFRIADADKVLAADFGKRLGWTENWSQGATLVVNPEVAKQLVNILPLTAEVEFLDNEMKISSGEITLLSNSLPQQEYNLATGSSQLRVKYRNAQSFEMTVNQPWQVLNHATNSGQLYLAPVMIDQMRWMDRLGEVMLKVDNKNIEGVLRLP